MARKSQRIIAVTGTRGVIGRLLLDRLATREDPIVAIDIERPTQKARFYPVDLVEPNTDVELERVFQKEACDTVVHLAYLPRPIFDTAYSHELQAIGTLNMLHAARSTGVRHVVSVSPATLYGAHGRNPCYITEHAPIHPNRDYEYLQDRAEADQSIVAFMSKYKDMTVVLLRYSPMLGTLCDNLYTRMLASRTTTTLFGYDPLLQFCYQDDVADAVMRAIDYKGSGVFNIGGSGVMPLSTALYHAEVIGVPIAHPIAYSLFQALWILRLTDTPSPHLDYLRYSCIVDTQRAASELKFHPRFTTQGALMEHLAKRRKAA